MLHDISMDLSIFEENMFCKAALMEVAFLVKCWLHCSCFLRVGIFTHWIMRQALLGGIGVGETTATVVGATFQVSNELSQKISDLTKMSMIN
jgi:hypothetical protein